eukprot:TRINITY_DN1295_c0_g1_i1.p1 TRINITY_DN1295_c0_g1~~TRINITY_DN1295_c0_g1_i1.p1  ORF type:complete len:184 (-),score=41.98 TRINITY_DN1295_c0_g1_i1:104-655(-)
MKTMVNSPLTEHLKRSFTNSQIQNKWFRESIMLGNKPMIEKYTDIHQKWGSNHIVQGNALVWSTFINNMDAVQRLVKSINVNEDEKQMNWAPIHFASINGNAQIISLLLENGANINQQDVHLETPLHLACWKGKENVVRILLLNGANPKLKNADGHTALDVAKKYKNENCRILIKKYLKYELI